VYAVARSVFLAGVVTAQIGNAFACRTNKAHNRQMGWISNLNLIGGVLSALLIIFALIYVPAARAAFDTERFPAIVWPFLLANSLTLYLFEWIRKRIVFLLESRRETRLEKPDPRR
jgi:magnesium-transporting ATPase (P-type)